MAIPQEVVELGHELVELDMSHRINLMRGIVERSAAAHRRDHRLRRSQRSRSGLTKKTWATFLRRASSGQSGRVRGWRRTRHARAASAFGDRGHSQGASTVSRLPGAAARRPASQQTSLAERAKMGHRPGRSPQSWKFPDTVQHNGSGCGRGWMTSQRRGTACRGAKMAQVGMSGGFCHIVLRIVENR